MDTGKGEGDRPGKARPGDGAAEGNTPRGAADVALTVALVIYVILLAVATIGEIFENETILSWFR